MAQISSGPVGILPGQSMFETDSTRKGILEARESFVRMVNVIFERTAIAVERPDAVAALEAETPVPDFMMWRQLSGERHVQTIPPASEYDEQVYSIEERDLLLMDPAFVASLATANRRVLVNGLSNDVPQWSVWTAIAPLGGIQPDTDPETVYSLARNYDFPAPGEAPLTRAQRNLLTQSLNDDGGLPPGSRVLMQGDAQTGGFWTIWEYAPDDATADENGFALRRMQTYRTQDFWEFIDWYAEGYDVANPPVVRYATAAARNAAENPVPNTKFVRLDDDGNGRWVWTMFADGAWNIVAREKGTIRLSEKLYDASREIIFEPLTTATTIENLRRVFNREGSWELRILIDALRDHAAFTDMEINEVFFSMLHFVHSQQDQVSWAFKTSFLNIGGYNESLRPVPVQPVDNTQNLLDYIEEVKPYRVKTRDFTRVVTPDIDVANLQVTDFDLPPYYEETTGKYRILSIGNPVDLEIIKTQRPWKDWYDNYQKTLLEPEYYEATQFNPVRHMNIKMTFDRVDHMPLIAEEFFKYKAGDELHFDTAESVDNRLIEVYINREKVKAKFVAGAGNRVFLSTTPPADADIRIVIREGLSFLLAADRAQRFYNPVAAEKNIRALLGLEPKIGVLDGGGFGDGDADYQVQIGAGYEQYNTGVAPMHYGLSDPLHSGDRPEELVVVGASESLTIKVKVEDGNTLSGPEMTVLYIDVPADNADDEIVVPWGPMAPQSASAVIVWRDGMRAVPGDDYTVDMNAGTIRINVVANLEPSRVLVEKVKVRVFGASAATVNVQVFPAGANLTLATATNPNGSANTTFVDAFDPSTQNEFPLYGARRLLPETDYTVSGSSLTITKAIDTSKKVIVTTFTQSDLMGLTTSVYNANTSNSYPVVNGRGEAYLWSTLDGLDRERNDLQGEPDQVTEPEFKFEMKGVKHAVVGSNSYPVSISTDGRRAIFFNPNGRCDVMDAKTGAVLQQYPRSKFIADFENTHPNHGLYQAGWYSMDDLPGTNYVVVSLFYYDLGYLTAVMIYEIVGDELVFYGSRFVPTPICTEIMAAGFDADGSICLSLLSNYENPVLVKLPKLDPINGDLWQSNYWNGRQSLKDADTTVHVSNEKYCMSGFYTYGRTGGRDGGGFIVPTPTGPRWYFYVSSGRIAYNISTTNARWQFAYNEGLTKPNGFMAYMDLNDPTPVARVLDPSSFDQNGPPFHDDRIQRNGTPEGPWTGVNGGQPRSSYTDQMQASPLVDGQYDSRFVVTFHKEYNGSVNAPEGMAIKAVLFYFDPNTGLFEYFKEVEGDTVDTVEQYGFPTYDRYDYRKVGPTVFWARDTGDVFEMFGDYDNNLITAAHIGDFKPETIVIPNDQKVIFSNFNPTAGVSNDSFIMSTARPGNDLLAPKETGDYDARPLNDLSHDVGVVGGSNPATLITVNSVSRDAIRSAAASAINPDLLIIRKVKDGRPLSEYQDARGVRAGDIVIEGNALFKARVNAASAPVSNLAQWSPYGSPTSLVSISDQSLLPAVMTALAPFSPSIVKQIADTPIMVQRSDAWEFIRYEAAKGALVDDLPVDATEIVISVSGPMPFTPPTYQKVAKSKKKSKDKDALTDGTGVKKVIEAPGVVWINGERIEFFDYSEGEGTVTLRELRRGTHGTQISMETRAINRASSQNAETPDAIHPRGDGKTKVFMLNGSFADTNNLDVVLHGALKEADGTVRVMDFYAGYDVFLPQRRDLDYTAHREANGIRVTFKKAPENNVEVIIAKTSAQVHRAGSGVSDGRSKFDIRPDQAVGGMVFY